MSIQIVGMPKKKKNVFDNLKVHASSVSYTDVSVDISSYHNRRTEYKTLKKYLENGYDERLWTHPSVAELPNGERFLYDGDHRRHMYKIAFPDKKTMPAKVIKVSSAEEISKLFIAVNKSNIKRLTTSECYVHEVLSADKTALTTEDFLKAAKLTVSMQTGEEGSYVGSDSGFFGDNKVTVNIGRFKTCISLVKSDKSSITNSSKIIQDLFKCEHERGTPICAQFLSGLSLIFSNTKLTPHHKAYKSFVSFLHDHKKRVTTQKLFSATMRSAGGSVSNHIEKSVALGILSVYQSTTPSELQTIKEVFGPYKKQLQNELKNK